MSAKASKVTVWRSGFCNPANPEDSHKRCGGVRSDGVRCVCQQCHQARPMLVRKKPVVVEAFEFDGSLERATLLAQWCGGEVTDMVLDGGRVLAVRVPTLEGDMLCPPGWFLIKGTRGEFYPCRSDAFWDTFERVRD